MESAEILHQKFVAEFSETLTGHVSQDTAFVVDDYPYGFRLRTQIRYWIETKKGFGQRFVSQTLNPKTDKWNKPKASNYHVVAVMVRNPANGYVSYETLQSGGWSKENEIQSFEARRAVAIGDWERKAIQYIRATNRVNELVKVEIHGARDGEVPQTCEEQRAIYDAALRQAYAEQGESARSVQKEA